MNMRSCRHSVTEILGSNPESSLPKTMVHAEGGRTVTVSFAPYEKVDGFTIEKECHRTTGDSRFDAVIQFTKTVLDVPADPSLFSLTTPAAK